jgi:hypothetical protein
MNPTKMAARFILIPLICFLLLPLKSMQAEKPDFRQERMPEKSDTAWFWDFNRWGDPLGWAVPEKIKGSVMGGALRIKITPASDIIGTPHWRHMVWGQDRPLYLKSPVGLEIDAARFTKIKMRLLNKSPETDGLMFWNPSDDKDSIAGPVRFTMKPDASTWHEITCHVDGKWEGTIDRIIIQPAQMWWRGDIWIDWIAVTAGEPRIMEPRPDLVSERIIPKISIPGISQSGFRDAFRVLDECLVTDVPMKGFNYPFLAPGGAYGQNWWQLDGSLNIAGAKWVNQELAEGIMRGYAEVQAQNPDGRIDLWGGAPVRGQVADVSSIPRYFEAAWDVARRTSDPLLREMIYETMKKYLGYWFSPSKMDESSGLVTAVFEETFYPTGEDPGILAAVDLNVAVAKGCYLTSQLAGHLGYLTEAGEYARQFDRLSQHINRILWHPERDVYLNYHVVTGKHDPSLYCSTFDPLQLGIVPPERIDKLLKRLLDPTHFNWGLRPVTSLAMTDPAYVEAEGTYDGRAWLGDLWTMRNMPIINGLKDIGRHDLAGELNWSTIRTFHENYCEFVVPSTGSGDGVKRYGWTASQYVQAIIENLFGIDYDRLNKRLRILPNIPPDLSGEKIGIGNLSLPEDEDTRLGVAVETTGDGMVHLQITLDGQLPDTDLEVLWPVNQEDLVRVSDGKGSSLPILRSVEGLRNVAGIRIPLSAHQKLHFTLEPLAL